MTEFNRSNWAKSAFSREYRENADVFIVERQRMLAVLGSFYCHFVMDGTPKAVLDLGCGDGIITSVIAGVDDSIFATLIDASEDMLIKARERLSGLKAARYLQTSFQELVREDGLDRPFDFVASSLAIHHLTMAEKASLFRRVYAHLNDGGYFVNIDVILAPSESLEQWYLSLWREWIGERKTVLRITDNRFDDIVQRYKNTEENRPDTLEDQLTALKSCGFQDVDCYYKYGIFTIYGGRRP